MYVIAIFNGKRKEETCSQSTNDGILLLMLKKKSSKSFLIYCFTHIP